MELFLIFHCFRRFSRREDIIQVYSTVYCPNNCHNRRLAMHLYRLYACILTRASLEVRYISLSAARMTAITAGLQCIFTGCVYTHSRM